jgi:hypothetical protein
LEKRDTNGNGFPDAGEITANVSKIPVHLPVDLPKSKRKRRPPERSTVARHGHERPTQSGARVSSDSPRNAAGLGKGLESLYCSIQAAE